MVLAVLVLPPIVLIIIHMYSSCVSRLRLTMSSLLFLLSIVDMATVVTTQAAREK